MGLVVQGLYSFGDALAKGITLVSMRIAKRPPSKMFPFGYGKILFVSSLTIGAWLLFGGISLGLASIDVDIEGVQSIPFVITLVGVLLSASASELTHRLLRCIARENDHRVIESAASDNRIDALSSAMVLLGIILLNIGIPAADHVSAFIISLMMIRLSGMMVWDAIKGLLDVSIPRETLDEIMRTARTIQGVQDIKLIRGRSLGEYWEIYLHIALDEGLSINDGFAIVQTMKERIQGKFSKIQHVWVVTIPQESRREEGESYWKDHLFQFKRGDTANLHGDTVEHNEDQK